MKFLPTIAIVTTLLFVADASASQRYAIAEPVLQGFNYNGIEATLTLALKPLGDRKRPLAAPQEMTAQQKNQIDAYFRLEEQCRGGNPGPKTDQACNDRNAMDLKKLGLCFGEGKKSLSMAEMEWRPCLPPSDEYEVGSESVSISCRRDGEQNFSFQLLGDRLTIDDEFINGQAIVRIPATKQQFPSEYSLLTSDDFRGRTRQLSFDFKADAAEILYKLYDGESVAFSVKDEEVSVSSFISLDKKVLDEIARMYSACKK